MSIPIRKPTAQIAPKSSAAKPDISASELLDRTMELDIRGLLEDSEIAKFVGDSSSGTEDPTVVLDLTATQVHDLLIKKDK